MLAAWECAIGLGLLTTRFLRATLLLLAVQMVGTAMPLILFPAETFTRFPLTPTLEGQYIIKNVVLIGAGMVIGGYGPWWSFDNRAAGRRPHLPYRVRLPSGNNAAAAVCVRSDPDGSWLRRPRKVDQKQAVCYRDCCPRMLSGDDGNLAITDLYLVLSYT